ncbi:MAG: hypothetical protein FWG98_01520 [Candidatus Cloacimonetes bacterium]|nr:hypothetical protein [Candidatus Cloacimonadota bacterium]
MEIKFKDINTGRVEARALVKLHEGLILNEISILNIEGDLVVELPKKSFISKTGKLYSFDVITFETEDERTLFCIQIKDAFLEWRKKLNKMRVFEG